MSRKTLLQNFERERKESQFQNEMSWKRFVFIYLSKYGLGGEVQ